MNKLFLILLWSYSVCPVLHTYFVDDNLNIKFDHIEYEDMPHLTQLGAPKWYVGSEKVLCVCCDEEAHDISISYGLLTAYCRNHSLKRDSNENS